MSNRLYVYFKPQFFPKSLAEVGKLLNEKYPGFAAVCESSGGVDINNEWSSFIDYPTNYLEDEEFPYLAIYSYCYWDSVINGLEFRTGIKKICEALGATEWWYVEESSLDYIDDLSTDEFENKLTMAPNIEQFDQPRYFPSSGNHIFKDSAHDISRASATLRI